MRNLRIIAIFVLLALSVAVDFTSRVMSILSDGALVAGAVLLLLPLLKITKTKPQ